MQRTTKSLFPVFLKLSGRRVLVVGAGPVAASKVGALLDAGALIDVVAPDVLPSIATMGVRVFRRPFRPDDLADVWFVVAAATPTVNAVVSREAEQCGVFVNAVDEPENASAYLGSVVRRAGVTFAISTDGRAPALAGLLREGLEAVLPETDLEGWVAEAKKMRQVWRTDSVPIEDRRPQLLRALMKRYEDAHTDGSQGDVSSPHR
jgi:uroporphyrin-III C-methyltransferase/precorrin-2 dehydrogenase/sirohydrochlorin ferrochelatase